MLILATAHLYRTLAKAGVQWTGVTSAYIFALIADVGLIALLIWCATGRAA